MCEGAREIQNRWVHVSSPLFLCIYNYVSILSHTECTVTDLTDLDIPSQDEVVDPRCTDRGSVISITGGVVCYNGTNAGSRAVYICDNNTQRINVTRVCGVDGIWNGSILSCPGITTPTFTYHHTSIHLSSHLHSLIITPTFT